MPIPCQCPHCRKPFRVADKFAGKAVKCPGCQGVVRVSQAEGAAADTDIQSAGQSWYILCEDGEQLGPVSKEQLDNLATQGRLSFCQVRRQDWRNWKWADDVYPDLPADRQRPPADRQAGPKDDRLPPQSARLVTCPDCGNRVSVRAIKCPHCGCPAANLGGEMARSAAGEMSVAPPPAAAGADRPVAATRRSWRFHALIAALMLLLVAMIATPLVIWWQVRRAAEEVSGLLEPVRRPVAEEVLPAESGEALLSPQEKTACIDQAAEETARRIDGLQSRNHLAKSLLGSSLEGLEMLDALAGGDLNAIPDSTGTVPGGAALEPYPSQFEALFAECRDYVRQKVKRGACTKSDVRQTAEAWASEKQRAIEQELMEKLPRQPGPRERSAGK